MLSVRKLQLMLALAFGTMVFALAQPSVADAQAQWVQTCWTSRIGQVVCGYVIDKAADYTLNRVYQVYNQPTYPGHRLDYIPGGYSSPDYYYSPYRRR